jgi:hypothetical protein
MNQLRLICVIEDLDGHFLAFAKAENGARDGAVVADGLDVFAWSDLEFNRGDTKRGIWFGTVAERATSERGKQRQTSPGS